MIEASGKCQYCGSDKVTLSYGPGHNYGAELFNLDGTFSDEPHKDTKKEILEDISKGKEIDSVEFSCEDCEVFCSADVKIGDLITDDAVKAFKKLIPIILGKSLHDESFKPGTPNGFYFQVITEASGTNYLITPIEYYDKEGALSDESGIADKVVPEGFYELSESCYEYEGSAERGRQLLLEAGFKEIDFGFNNTVAPVESNDEEFDEEHQMEPANQEDNLDVLLGQNKEVKTIDVDYKDVSTDKLLRHIKIMIMSESYEEAEKIKSELHSRGVTEF